MTGFAFFPLSPFKPGHAVAILSLILLAAAVYALYIRKLAGTWRVVYLTAAIASQYFNVFVLIIQSFQKIPALHALAPTQSELPFAVTQLVTLVAFIVLGVMAVKRTRPRLAV